jgi:hypothetical protein
MTRVSRSWSFAHLSRLGCVAGILLLGDAIARDALGFVRPALVLFVISAVSDTLRFAPMHEGQDV